MNTCKDFLLMLESINLPCEFDGRWENIEITLYNKEARCIFYFSKMTEKLLKVELKSKAHLEY